MTTDDPQRPLHAHRAALLRFEATRVVAVYSGGVPLGTEIALMLELPLHVIDVRYPLSRLCADRRLLRALLFPVKELVYRMTSPTIGDNRSLPSFSEKDTVLLVDHFCSSFKTIAACLDQLSARGVDRSRIRIVVGRAGRRAASRVDLVISGRSPAH